MAPNKRPHKTLTLSKKCEILDSLDKSGSIRQTAANFGVPRSTIFDIKKNKDKIRNFVSKSYQGTGMCSITFCHYKNA